MKAQEIDFDKENGLVPAIIQDAVTAQVLMLGYMNEEAYQKTLAEGIVTFYSRSKQRLWTKGETSGNTLELVDIKADCDRDTLLVRVRPNGPTCHTGTDTCWSEKNKTNALFLEELERVILERQANPVEGSYTNQLFEKGLNKITQKVGEEAIELVIEAKDDNKELFLNEAADFFYHFEVLLAQKGYRLREVMEVLKERHQ